MDCRPRSAVLHSMSEVSTSLVWSVWVAGWFSAQFDGRSGVRSTPDQQRSISPEGVEHGDLMAVPFQFMACTSVMRMIVSRLRTHRRSSLSFWRYHVVPLGRRQYTAATPRSRLPSLTMSANSEARQRHRRRPVWSPNTLSSRRRADEFQPPAGAGGEGCWSGRL